MSTEKNLKEAFAGESQAYQKYSAFAKKAEAEGYLSVSRLFKAAADAEKIHAASHLKALDGIKTTAENLKEGIEGETFEFEKMYPPMIEEAIKEGNKQAERSFHFANEAEKVHAKLYQDALDDIEAKEDFNYYLCPACGNVTAKEAPEKCFICGVKGSAFIKY